LPALYAIIYLHIWQGDLLKRDSIFIFELIIIIIICKLELLFSPGLMRIKDFLHKKLAFAYV